MTLSVHKHTYRILYNIIFWEKCNIFAFTFFGYVVKGMILPENG